MTSTKRVATDVLARAVTLACLTDTTLTEGDRRLAEAIATRRSDRLPFGPVTDWPAFETVLRSRIAVNL